MSDLIEAMALAIRTHFATDMAAKTVATAALAALRETHHLVPKDDDTRPFSDSLLPMAMIEAGEAALEKAAVDLANYVPGETIDWDYGMEAVAVYRAMIAAYALEKRHD